MNEIRPFQFDEATVRAVVIDGEPYFVGKDLATALGYANETDAMNRHCKGVVKRYPLRTAGGVQDTRVLTEADMMRLIISSTLPAAERFERWVFEDVLPAIRRTGTYSLPKKAQMPGLLAGPAREFRAAHGVAKLIGLKGNQATLAANKATVRAAGVDLLDYLGASKLVADVQEQRFTVTQLGQRLGMGAAAVNNLLIDRGYQLRNKSGKRNTYAPTDKGRRYAVLVDTDKLQGEGKPVQQWEWHGSILPLLAVTRPQEGAAA